MKKTSSVGQFYVKNIKAAWRKKSQSLMDLLHAAPEMQSPGKSSTMTMTYVMPY